MSQSDAEKKAASSAASSIPDKLYFRIGDVARLLGVAPYVLRFWESEFPHLKPNKGGTGQRLYRRRDVEAAFRIRQLLYDEGYTIAGARQALKAEAKSTAAPKLPLNTDSRPDEGIYLPLRRMRIELREIAAILARPSPLLGKGAQGNTSHKGLHVAATKKTSGTTPGSETDPLFRPEQDDGTPD